MKKKNKDAHSKKYRVRSHERMKSVVRVVSKAVIVLAIGMVMFGFIFSIIQ